GGLTGRVITAAGEPVASLPVELIGGRPPLLRRGPPALLQEGGPDLHPPRGPPGTGAGGPLPLPPLEPRPPGRLRPDPGGPRALLWPLEVTPVSGETRDVGDIKLPEAVTLLGRVVDEHGTPIAGARVRATDFPYASALPDVAQFRKGGGGVFVNPRDS